ncbi:hypothetical protein CC86DRAFT_430719 [Ophiobolus disseminans]|uniref:Uncharacterized protein n=1 Tax=Ophiobolus disseminans TaxID=1469910 RepID=A0A6A7ACT4_9PLEO|nr:hypothetical protein CC86DRAFT_430719 [Ophiobolus disseminans]
MNDQKGNDYDVPTEWMPSANFAFRPASEISELYSMDATFIISSSSSSSLSGEENSPPSRRRSTFVSSDTPRTPTIKVTGPDKEAQRSRMRSVDEDVKVMDRPRLRKKSATAPPCGMNMPGYTPQAPRRASSARRGELNTIQGRTAQQKTYVTNPQAVGKRHEGEQVVGQKRMPPPVQPPPWLPRNDEQSVNNRLANNGSFSRKARVRKTLNDKNLGRLSIVDFESHGLLSSPRSMMITPRELYAIPEKRSTDREPSSSSAQDPSSPHSVKARRSIMSNQSPLSPRFQQSRRGHSRKPKGKNMRQDTWQRIYVPGVIRLEKHPATLRKDSVATLDPFDQAVEPQGKRYSDMIVLNSLAMFFADLSVVEDATEQCLDRFWCDTRPVSRYVTHEQPSIASIQEVPESLKKPQNAWGPRGSRFSFSSASSSSSMPPTGTPMRQRDKLRRLLSPAFVGSAKKTPGGSGHQGDIS